MTEAIYPNRELILCEDGTVEDTPRERFLNEVHKEDNVLVSVVLSPRSIRNILPDGSEVVSTERPSRVVDVEGKILELDSKYAQILTKYRPVRGVNYAKDGRRHLGFRVVRIPLDSIGYHQPVPFGRQLTR